MGCAFLLATRDWTDKESLFRLTVGATVFSLEIHAIKKANADALRRDLVEIDISNSRLALQAFYYHVSRH